MKSAIPAAARPYIKMYLYQTGLHDSGFTQLLLYILSAPGVLYLQYWSLDIPTVAHGILVSDLAFNGVQRARLLGEAWSPFSQEPQKYQHIPLLVLLLHASIRGIIKRLLFGVSTRYYKGYHAARVPCVSLR